MARINAYKDNDKSLTFFNVGRSYQLAAKKLLDADQRISGYYNPSVVRLNFAISVELYLKSFLLACGLTPKQLGRSPYGHDLNRLLNTAENYGLNVTPSIAKRIRRMGELQTVIKDRYLDWEFNTVPAVGTLDDLAEELRSVIGPIIASRDGHLISDDGLSPRVSKNSEPPGKKV